MLKSGIRRAAVLAFALSAVAGCKSTSTEPPAQVAPTLGGLQFSLSGATYTVVDGALPTGDASFTTPTTLQNRAPSATSAATLSVASAEDFDAILIRPAGATSYVRISMPAQTRLIGISVITAPGSQSVATVASIAVARATRVSNPTTHSFFPLGS